MKEKQSNPLSASSKCKLSTAVDRKEGANKMKVKTEQPSFRFLWRKLSTAVDRKEGANKIKAKTPI